MFELPTHVATTERVTAGTLLGEVVATAGLIMLILALARTGRSAAAAPAIGAYIGAAYWFTSSTSFANPAVTIGRIFSDSFAGIAPASVLPFIAAQLVGAAIGVALTLALFRSEKVLAQAAADVVIPQTTDR
jgi:glycerol uptake facilitator-like aquaporin